MKKTRMLVAFVLVLAMVLTVGLTACDNHQHEFEEDWTITATHHYHKATCGHDVTSGRAAHKFDNAGVCTVCDFDRNAEGVDLLPFANGTVLRIAAGYNNANTGITFSAENAGSGITLPDGKTYHTGDLKPTWVQIEGWLGVKFENKYQGKSTKEEFGYWKDQLEEVDIVAGTASLLQEAGAEGKLVDLAQYLDSMPNFKAYLDQNAIVRLSITGDTETGAIYFSPYFDGVDDIERYPLIRADFVRALLDGSETYHGANRALKTAEYTPYMPTSGSVAIESLTADGLSTQTITKNYEQTGNIISQMNAALTDGGLSGDAAVAMFRAYIDNMYAGVYENRSDLFLGADAAWDADELVALLRCAVASLNDKDGNPIVGLFPREENNNQRRVDLFRFAGSLFGVRGMESRSDYLWFDSEGNVRDARQEEDAYELAIRMNAIANEGLIVTEEAEVNSKVRVSKNSGLVSYDYSQTQTAYNTEINTEAGEEYTVMMVPVAHWFDGTNVVGEEDKGVYMRFTESWRSVKTDGWAISAAGVAGNQDKLNAALKLIDFAFSVQGQITMSYGSEDFIQIKEGMEGWLISSWDEVALKYETFNFNGQAWPLVTDEMNADLWSRAGGNYTNYARFYLGSTLNGFPKSQAFEIQCTHELGRAGAERVSAAIGAGIVKHPELAIMDNMWYTSIPTTLPHTEQENGMLNTYTDLTSTSHFGQASGNNNIFLNIIDAGLASVDAFEGKSITTAAAAAALVSGEWNGRQYLNIKQAAWERLLAYYESLNA